MNRTLKTTQKGHNLSPHELDALGALLDASSKSLEAIPYYDYLREHECDREILDDLEERRYVERDYESSTIELTYRGLLGIESPRSKSICCDCDSIFMFLRDRRRQSTNDIRLSANKILASTHLSYFRTIKCLRFMKHIDGLEVIDLNGEDPRVFVSREILEFETFSEYAITHTPSPLMNSVLLEPMTWATEAIHGKGSNPNRQKSARKPQTLEDINRSKYQIYRAALMLLSENPAHYVKIEDNRIDVRVLSVDIYEKFEEMWPEYEQCPLEPHAIAECLLSL